MEETRTEKISVNLTPSVLARLDDMRARRRWTRSTAAAVLIEHGLDSEDRMTALAGEATTSQEYTALTQENLGAGSRDDDRSSAVRRRAGS
jgi:metal-responsive CopG/Arc/MetJ family transcriptional regulator